MESISKERHFCLGKYAAACNQTSAKHSRYAAYLEIMPYEERMLELGLPTLIYRRKRNDMIQVFKILNDIDKLDKDLFFKPAQVSQTRGHSHKLKKKHNRLNLRANAFSQRVINQWNRLPNKCVSCSSLNNFKSNLNEHWKHHEDKFHCK